MATLEQNSAKWYQVNKPLLPVKALYFLLFSAGGCLWPYLPLYMHQLGFSLSEVGSMYSMAKFTNLFAQPAIGGLADKFQKHRLALITSLVAWGLTSALLLILPAHVTVVSPGIKMDVMCRSASFMRHYENSKNVSPSVLTCSEKLFDFFTRARINETASLSPFTCVLSSSNVSQICFNIRLNGKAKSVRDRFVAGVQSNYTFDFMWTANESHSTTFVPREPNSLQNEMCHRYLENVNYQCTLERRSACGELNTVNCEVLCHPSSENNNTNSHLPFWIFAITFLVFNIAFSNTETVSNAVTYNILDTSGSSWGRQRLYGSLGYGLFAVTVSFIMDERKKSQAEVDYSVTFYVFSGLCFLAAILCLLLPVSRDLKCTRFLTNIRRLIGNPNIFSLLVIVFCFGIMSVLSETFVFLFLRSLGSDQIVFGLAVVVRCATEIPLFFVSGKIINRLGHHRCLYAVCVAYAVRFIGYSLLTNGWYILPLEMLQGVTFSIFYAAASSYLNVTAPRELVATAQGLLQGVHFAFGAGVGNIVTGVLFDAIGARWTFRAYSMFAVIALFVYMVVNSFYLKHRKIHEEVECDFAAVTTDIEVKTELLHELQTAQELSVAVHTE